VTTYVDSAGNVGAYSSIALDGSGNAHISYSLRSSSLPWPPYDHALKYATNASSGAWVTTTVDSAGDVGSYTTISVDGSGKAHISYRDGTNYALKYATNISGTWMAETACDRFLGNGGYTSIALTADGAVHISHHGDDGTLLITSGAASFSASRDSGGVLIEWETASEVDIVGFNLWRSETEGDDYEKINEVLIPGEGDPSGAEYGYLDEDVVAGTTYYYKLETVDIHGESQFSGPVLVTVPQGWGAAEAQASLMSGTPARGSILASALTALAPPFIVLLGWRVYRRRQKQKGQLC